MLLLMLLLDASEVSYKYAGESEAHKKDFQIWKRGNN